jgi:hypothetical protein
MAAKTEKKQAATKPEALEGSTSRIRAVVERTEPAGDALTIIEQIRAVHKGLKKKDRRSSSLMGGMPRARAAPSDEWRVL